MNFRRHPVRFVRFHNDRSGTAKQTERRTAAFTLIELMIVVAIMGIVMVMSVPLVYRVLHKEALRKSVTDIIEVCSHARARAILQGSMTEVVFHPKEKRLEVSGGSGAATPGSGSEGGPVQVGNPAPSSTGLSAALPENIDLQMVAVNLIDYVEVGAEVARVRFYPNGTCDELTVIVRDEKNEQRGVTLEVTTSLATVLNEADLQKLRNGHL